MKNKKTLFTLLGAGIALLLGWSLHGNFPSSATSTPPLGGESAYSRFTNFSTTSVFNISGAASARLLGTSTNNLGRTYAIFVNSGSAPAYLCLNSGRDCGPDGIYLASGGGRYEIIGNQNSYQGAVTASSTVATSITVNAVQQ